MSTPETTTQNLLNGKQLAKTLDVPEIFVTAMRAPVEKSGGGFAFVYGGRTTVAAAMAWMEQHPNFRYTDYIEAHRKSPKKPLPPRRKASPAKTRSNQTLLRVELPNGYMVWDLNERFRKILRPIARKFALTIEEFLRLYSANQLANQPRRQRRLDESDMPVGFSVSLGNDKRALERIQRAAEFSGHTIESMAWQSIAGFVDCCEDDMIFHPVTGKPVGDEVVFGKFLLRTERWPIAA